MNSSLSRRSVLMGAAVSAIGLSGCAAKAGSGSGNGTDQGANSGNGGNSGSGANNSVAPSGTTTSSSGGGGAANTTGTITLMGYAGEHSKEELAAFTKRSGIKVNMVEYTYDKFVAMLAAGNAPDVVRATAGFDCAFLGNKKMAEPLDPYIEKSSVLKKDDLGDINNMWRWDGTKTGEGQLLGLIKDYSSDLTVWVNKALCPGVKEGEVMDFDKMKDLALKATKIEGGRVKTYGWDFYESKPHISWLNYICRTAGKEIFNADRSQVDLTSDEAVKGMQFLRDLVEAKATISSFNKSTIGYGDLFKAGRLGMLQSGYWTQGLFADVKPDIAKNFVLLPAPKMGSERVSPVLAGSGHFIPAQSKKKDLAWKFMEDYFGGEPAKARAASGWGVPSLKSLVSLMPTKTDINKQALATQKEEDKYFTVLSFTPYAKIDGIGTAMGKVFDEGIKAKKETKAICEDATKAINDLISRGKR